MIMPTCALKVDDMADACGGRYAAGLAAAAAGFAGAAAAPAPAVPDEPSSDLPFPLGDGGLSGNKAPGAGCHSASKSAAKGECSSNWPSYLNSLKLRGERDARI